MAAEMVDLTVIFPFVFGAIELLGLWLGAGRCGWLEVPRATDIPGIQFHAEQHISALQERLRLLS
jgi:hypothetical protein